MAQPGLTHEELCSQWLTEKGVQNGTRLARKLADSRICFTTWFESDYPFMLSAIADAPPVLFYSGSLSALHKPCIAVVGSRSCTDYGMGIAAQTAAQLCRWGFTVVSGLALGIDGRAHAACLEVNGLTGGVLGCGLQQIYPKSHRQLAVKMVREGGVIISELPPRTPPKPHHFPVRNRIISGLCHATIVVEGKLRSGSLLTARHCLDQGRDLFAVPGPINRPTSQGPNALIERGEAAPFLSTQSLLPALAHLISQAAEQETQKQVIIQDQVARTIYDRLDAFEPKPLELLLIETGLNPGEVMANLVDLETKNLVIKKPGPAFLRNPLSSSNTQTT